MKEKQTKQTNKQTNKQQLNTNKNTKSLYKSVKFVQLIPHKVIFYFWKVDG